MPHRPFLLAIMILAGVASELPGQRVRPQPVGPVTTAPLGSAPGTSSGLVPVPLNRTPQYSHTTPAALLQPTFDPYATKSDAASSAPSLLTTPVPQGTTGGSSIYWQPPPTAPPGYTPTPGYPSTGTVAPLYPQQPPVLFPNGIAMPSGFPQPQPGPYLRLCQDIRFEYTWLAGGDDPDAMSVNAVDLASTINFPNFLFSGVPLQVSPEFIFDFWSGPHVGPPFALPSQAYSAFVTFGWEPMLTPSFGADLDVGIGVFSDFEHVDEEALRTFGTGLLVLRLTPTCTIKGGVTYLDRVDVKLLPAGGILWTPNPQTRFDFYFPQPKLAQYCSTIGNTDVWWYLNAEYGGGSWNIDQVDTDINDIRVGGGLEWTKLSGVKGFVETAYVFDREIVYDSLTPRYPLEDTIMVRGGLTY